MGSYVLCFVTIDDFQKAVEISRSLVNEKLAACANIVSSVKSIYFWKDQLCEENEHLILLKTESEKYSEMEQCIRRLHPYEVPEIISIRIDQGLPEYLRWIHESLSRA